jgi:predicted DNA-binding transcriptional regulator YafY
MRILQLNHNNQTMAINNDAAFRHRIINRCLRNNMRKWTKKMLLETINEELAEKYQYSDHRKRVEIKERQLNYDFNDMEAEYGAPIERYRDGKGHFYRYSDPAFSIENIPVNEQDLQTLREAVNLLRQIRGFSISEDMDAVVRRLENKIKTGSRGEKPVIAFENPPIALGTEYLSDLYESILQKTALKIDYQPFKAPEPQTQLIHPYFLKEYNNRWFLFGWNEGKERMENLPLDRIRKIAPAKTPYKTNEMFDAETFFADMIGVTRPPDAKVENIEIKVAAERAPYLRSKALHHSQQILHTYKDGALRIGFKLILNFELENLLMGFGPQIEVLKPAILREKMKGKMEEAFGLYK